MNSVVKKLKNVYKNSEIVPFDRSSKFIIMSDCHRGQGNTGDNFLPNQLLHFGALEYYYNEGFTYIELGDGDELWQNRKMRKIIEAHSDVFWLMSRFYKENRLYMLYGNHDVTKKRESVSDVFGKYYCESTKCSLPLFPGIRIREGLVLRNTDINKDILLVHGHQGSFLNDTIWPAARFLVRYVWGPLDMVGLTAPTGAARSHTSKEKIEKKLASYADSENRMLIAGHTHRPVFPEPGKSLYFNDGSCVHPRCITGIEIENNRITLVKWAVGTNENRSLYVDRYVLEGPCGISEFYRDTVS